MSPRPEPEPDPDELIPYALSDLGCMVAEIEGIEAEMEL